MAHNGVHAVNMDKVLKEEWKYRSWQQRKNLLAILLRHARELDRILCRAHIVPTLLDKTWDDLENGGRYGDLKKPETLGGDESGFLDQLYYDFPRDARRQASMQNVRDTQAVLEPHE
jgi:hypothetical protein